MVNVEVVERRSGTISVQIFAMLFYLLETRLIKRNEIVSVLYVVRANIFGPIISLLQSFIVTDYPVVVSLKQTLRL